MKIRYTTLLASLTLLTVLPAYSAENGHGHSHDEGKEHSHEHAEGETEKVAGPNGGRVMTSLEPHLEILVTEDRHVQVTALDEENKPAELTGQSVSVIAGDRRNPTTLTFEEKEGALLSTAVLPEGDNLPMIVSVKPAEDAKAVIEKFNLNMNQCPTCEYKEYACICGHEEAAAPQEKPHGHDH